MTLNKPLQTKSGIWKKFFLCSLLLCTVYLTILSCSNPVYAVGLVDDTINPANEYSKYDTAHYRLDFYVDTGWDWLPWNWGDGIGKQVNYAMYAISDFVWTVSRLLSNATGYMVQEAYRLDFVGQTADSIGKNMQTIAGVSPSGITSGFYSGFLLLFLLITGVYVAYTGLMKRETTKALRAIINFVVIFIVSGSVIAYAPDYIKKVNELSTDVSTASLEVGTKMVMPNTTTSGKDSVDLIRDSLFSIQVQQPWLLLQFGNADKSSIGESRVDALLSVHPDTNNGKDRENAVKNEIENEGNQNLSINQTAQRLGMVFFLFLFNIGISVFVFLLTGIMIFSQILFIIYAMFLPISFLMSLLPTFEGTSKRAVVKLFNILMTRAGITLIITVAFSISTMLYKLATGTPFFLIAFLQIVTFAGIFFKLNDLMSMFSLQGGESKSFGQRMVQRPYRGIRRQARNFKRNLPSISRIFRRNTGGNRSHNRRGNTERQSPESNERRSPQNTENQRDTDNRTDRSDNDYSFSNTSGNTHNTQDTDRNRDSGQERSPQRTNTDDRNTERNHMLRTENRQNVSDQTSRSAQPDTGTNKSGDIRQDSVYISGTELPQNERQHSLSTEQHTDNEKKTDNKNKRPLLFEKAVPKSEKPPVRERRNTKPQRNVTARTAARQNPQERPAVYDSPDSRNRNTKKPETNRNSRRTNITGDPSVRQSTRENTEKSPISPQIQEQAKNTRPAVVEVEQSRLSRMVERHTQKNADTKEQRPEKNNRLNDKRSRDVSTEQSDRPKEKRKRRKR